jgi:hypothetical protein
VPAFDARKSLFLGKIAAGWGTIMAQSAKLRTSIVHLRCLPTR